LGHGPGKRPTSFDIAYLAGVSQPTVSRALRGSRSVSQSTRVRIEQIARDLNYAVARNASSLRSQRTNTIALLFFEDPTADASMINPFYLSMLGSITRACARRGCDLLVSFQRMEDDWHVAYQDSRRADGLILLGYGKHTNYVSRLDALVASGTPFARWGSVSSDASGATIGSDNFAAGGLAAEHLLGCGRRRIAFIAHTTPDYPEFQQRHAGLVAHLADHGITADPRLCRGAISTEADGYAAARDLLASGVLFDGVFAGSDLIAIGAMRAFAEAGLNVPAEVAIIGFDDIPAASVTNPPLTTIAQDLNRAGERLVAAVLAQVDGQDRQPERLATQLVVRGTTHAC
jgi:DNA-binding LacI/PurR family transcriptional regulator